MATNEAVSLQKALAQIEQTLLPLVTNKRYGKICFEVELDAGRCMRILQTTQVSIKIQGAAT